MLLFVVRRKLVVVMPVGGEKSRDDSSEMDSVREKMAAMICSKIGSDEQEVRAGGCCVEI